MAAQSHFPTSAPARRTGRGEKLEAGPARFIGEPAPLGLAGFALSTMVLSFLNGAFGIGTAACAWYASFAVTANATTRRDWLPVGETRSVQQDAGAEDGRS